MFGSETHSLKPFLLDAIMGWCAVNKLTPILVIRQMDECVLPVHLMDRKSSKTGGFKDHLAFNVGQKAVLEKQITTHGISFTTFFKEHLHPERIVLPMECWVAVRVQETGHQFDLSFVELLQGQDKGMGVWPDGIGLVPAGMHSQRNPPASPHQVGSSVTAPLPSIRLVRVDGKAVEREQDGAAEK